VVKIQFKSSDRDVGSRVIRNVDILPQHDTASQPRRPRLQVIFIVIKEFLATGSPTLPFM